MSAGKPFGMTPTTWFHTTDEALDIARSELDRATRRQVALTFMALRNKGYSPRQAALLVANHAPGGYVERVGCVNAARQAVTEWLGVFHSAGPSVGQRRANPRRRTSRPQPHGHRAKADATR